MNEKTLGWQRIYSEGHVWVARLSDLAVNKMTFFPRKAKLNAAKIAVISAIGVVLSVGVAGAGAVLKTWAPESMFTGPKKFAVMDRTAAILNNVKHDSTTTSTGLTYEILADKTSGKPLAQTVAEQYVANTGNPADFAVLKSMLDDWPHNKVSVVKTDNGTWFGFRYKTDLVNYPSEPDRAAILYLPKAGGAYQVASSDRRQILSDVYQIAQMPREAAQAGIYEVVVEKKTEAGK